MIVELQTFIPTGYTHRVGPMQCNDILNAIFLSLISNSIKRKMNKHSIIIIIINAQ